MCENLGNHRNMFQPESCFTRVGSGLTRKQWARLERPFRDKHFSLLRTDIKSLGTLVPGVG